MILALVTGSLFKSAEARTSKNGKPFVAATIRTKDGDSLQFVRLVSFSETAQAELLRLADGDALSVQGPLSISIYTASDGNAKIGLSIVADHVLALRQPPRLRKPNPPDPAAPPDPQTRQARLAGTWTGESGDPNDDIGF